MKLGVYPFQTADTPRAPQLLVMRQRSGDNRAMFTILATTIDYSCPLCIDRGHMIYMYCQQQLSNNKVDQKHCCFLFQAKSSLPARFMLLLTLQAST